MVGREQRRTTAGSVTWHDLQCVAPTRYSHVRSDGVVLFLALLILCVSSWGACNTKTNTQCRGWMYPGETQNCNIAWGSHCSVSSFVVCGGNTININSCANIAPVLSCQDNGSECWPQSAGRYYFYSKCTITECTTQAEADSVRCVVNPSDPSCRVPDTTWTCTSVSTENGVIRASIQKYIDGTASGTSTEVLGSCIENGYCEGEYNASMLAMDSCSYDSISADKCKYGGQDGSACYYVCPDGQNHMCRMAVASGGTLPSCPSKPWKACADSINRKPNPNDSYNPGGYNPPSDSLADPSDDMPEGSDETAILLAIRDTLHHANEQRKYQMYVEENIYDVVAGYGIADGDGIIQNLRETNANTRATQVKTQQVATNTGNLVTGVNNLVTILEDSTIKAQIVGMPDSIYTWSATTPMVFRIDTTLERTREIIDDIRNLTDTLVSDTPRTNTILGRVAPTLDSALSFIVDNSPLGMVSSMAREFADSISAVIQPFKDYIVIDTAYVDSIGQSVDYVADVWGNETIVPIDSTPSLVTFNPSLDSVVDVIANGPFAGFNAWNDSVTAFADSVLQERIEQMKDTTKDTLPLDQSAGDSALIRNKLQDVFLPDEILYECFDFSLNHKFQFTIGTKQYSWDLKLLIDFADLFGLDLCDLIRKVVQILTFILIVFTTIKGYIRAFGGGDTL